METDINIPKTKAVNVFFQFARMQFYLTVFSNLLPIIISYTNQVCSNEGIKLISLSYKGDIVLLILNIISLLFIWLKEPFARLEFFVMYAINICWSGIMIGQTYLDVTTQPNECEGVILSQKLILFFHLKTHLEVLLTLFSPILFAFRITNLPNSFFAIYLILAANSPQSLCSRDISNIEFGLLFIALISCLIGLPLNIGLFLTKKVTIPNLFRFLLMLTIIGQSGLIALIYQADVDLRSECSPTHLLYRSYLYIIPITILSALSLLFSMPVQDHDEIRQLLIQARMKPLKAQLPIQQDVTKAQVQQNQDEILNKSAIDVGKSPIGAKSQVGAKSQYGTISRRG
ncbi:unnamed protein product (macronuclear) [Paramecium tetraurelia]|uniref:Transmembrane protein n=1 Tax=Paramecium tetraurelia TaxID=5888 RepID=A0CZQ7_PARTE|nr:uncharacterized protein GSPATT00011847001 [Paramecium tetraurelia]CAK76274.1 unnamed protein product [Paramecium tetraurelia]|eukprot:XP_001443671.1 hypothetical protein (macronuclear) [Paramecium tetraurelia strain d4-2]